MPLPSNAHLNWHPFIGYCRHEDLIVAVPTMLNYIDFGIVNGITGLSAWPTARFPFPPGRKPDRGGIFDMSVPMQGQGTDATLIVMHVPVPFTPGALLALIIILGSSKIIMASRRTRIWCRSILDMSGETERPVGCCVFPYIPLSLNLQCWDIPSKKLKGNVGAPMMTDIVIAPNTVQVGVGLTDYLWMMMEWAVEIATAIIMAKVFNSEPKPPTTSKKWYKKLLDKKVTKKWLTGIVLLVPYKVLVKNSAWYREPKEDAQGWLLGKLPDV
jgi:hypothetical protein